MHKLQASFEIDDGSLEGLAPELIFSMGVEFLILLRKIQVHKEPFREFCLAPNGPRIEALAAKYDRFSEIRPVDCTNEWVEIWVGDTIRK